MGKLKTPKTKKSRALRRLVGSVVVAGATYAVEKYIESRKRKKV